MKQFFFFIICLTCLIRSSDAQIPNKMNYQGLLTSSSVPVTDGIYTLQFNLYDSLSGGTSLWTETQSVSVTSGTFNATLGNVTPLIAFTKPLYLEMTATAGPSITTPTAFSPRAELVPSPYAHNSRSLLGPNSLATGTGAIAGGTNNRASGNYATVSGGGGSSASDSNSASGNYSTIGGGFTNEATGTYSTIAGGFDNFVNEEGATVGGGNGNTGYGLYITIAGGISNSTEMTNFATVVGGENNHATGEYSFIGGGGGGSSSGNNASGYYSSIVGGSGNQTEGDFSSIGGGSTNIAGKNYGTVGGGSSNVAVGYASTIAGGEGNEADSGSVIAGGKSNTANGAYSFVGGGQNNYVRGQFSVIAGGGGVLSDSNSALGDYSFIGAGKDNQTSGTHATVVAGNKNIASNTNAFIGGGNRNTASGDNAVVSGGYNNLSSELNSTIGGGAGNIASDWYATVPGGAENEAKARYTLAAGTHAKANHVGSTVITAMTWTLSNDTISSGGSGQMVLRADGGLYIGQNTTGSAPFDSAKLINTSSGAYLTAGGTWTNSSDKNKKEHFVPVDGKVLLEKLSTLPISMWNYIGEENNVKHIGPMAQDFRAMFGLGNDDKSISTIDPAGIALATIQELNKQNQSLQARIEELEKFVQSLATRLMKSGDESLGQLK
ncbi:MAG: tail fiber domain-containing protein [Ignavibacteriae bacterium]|nr:tail fiber domain-containing protein [Ignavibacteriota bacterium]